MGNNVEDRLPHASSDRTVTVVLTNYMRQRNMSLIIDALLKQTLRPKIFVWDNSSNNSFNDSRTDWVIRSSHNAKCGGRWWLAAQAQTRWVVVMDDDLCPGDDRVLEDTVTGLLKHSPKPVAAVGVKLRKNRSYRKGRHIGHGDQSISVAQHADILKGRFLGVASETLQGCPVLPLDCEDDIAMSGFLGGGIVLPCLQNRFREFPTGGESWRKRNGHYEHREAARRKFIVEKTEAESGVRTSGKQSRHEVGRGDSDREAVDNGIHEHGYWLDASKTGHRFDQGLVGELSRLFAGKSVIDIGCGVGAYVSHLNAANASCIGVDGNPFTSQLNPQCRAADVSQPQSLGRFDWVLSLEVGEHIPKIFEDNFIGNLHRHNREGIVVSWAIKGQKGRGHINCQDNDYVVGLFEALDYDRDKKLELRLRKKAKLKWLKKTLMVFRRQKIAQQSS